MCLLSVAGPGVVQRTSELALACTNNPDGFGYAVHAGDHIATERGMVADEIIDRYLATRAAFPDGPAIFHARFATHGDRNVDNCHPFRVGGDDRIVLAHNGILSLVVKKDDHRSDTSIYASEVLPRIGIEALDDKHWTAVTEAWLGANKVAILSVHPKLGKALYLLNGELGSWVEGIWWSNDSYRTEPAFAVCSGPLALDGVEVCEVCNHLLDETSLVEELCQHCGSCFWCAEPIDDCLCYPTDRALSHHEDAAWWVEQVGAGADGAFEDGEFEPRALDSGGLDIEEYETGESDNEEFRRDGEVASV